MKRTWLAAALALLAFAGDARADDPVPSPPPPPAPTPLPPKQGRGAWKSFRAGSNLVGSVPMAAILDSGWSISTQIGTSALDRTYTRPFPNGTIGHWTRRVLYGTSWALMLGIEGMITVLGSGGKLDWISGAVYRTDWMLPTDLPACSHTGANAGCGLGVGSFSFIQLRPKGSHWWYEAGGGWTEQRVLYDALRTVGDSSWVLTPISALREFSTDPDSSVSLRWLIGPGVYGGMHSANMHPSVRGQEIYRSQPWTELYPLAGGVGPGVRAELDLVVLRHLTLEGDLTVAPLLIGGSPHVSHDVAPLDASRDGIPVWRKLSAGIGWQDYRVFPFKTTLAFFGLELSDRSLDRIGYRGAMLRFDVPLKVPGE